MSTQPKDDFKPTGSVPDLEEQKNRRAAVMAALSVGLPTLPGYVFELNTLLNSTPVDLNRVSRVISTDPSLTAQVIKACNASPRGGSGRLSSIHDAVFRLGADRLRTLVLTCSLLELAGQRLPKSDVQSFWQHSFMTALLSERVARDIGYPAPEQAYLAGLLHDVGTLVFLMVTASEQSQWDCSALEGTEDAMEAERQRFGLDHCEVGSWVGVSWNFPSALVDAFRYHHRPENAQADPQLVGIVAASDQLCLRRGVTLGGKPQDLSAHDLTHDDQLLQACLPRLSKQETRKVAEDLSVEFANLTHCLEFGPSGVLRGAVQGDRTVTIGEQE